MDYIIQLIGVILIVTGGSTPGVDVDTAFIPISVEGRKFCEAQGVTKVVEKHEAYIRVKTDRINRKGTDWPEEESCGGLRCTLFRIPEPSELTVNAGFDSGRTQRGLTFCQLPRLADRRVNVRLIDDPRSRSIVSFALPGGTLEAPMLRGGSTFTRLHVRAPIGSSRDEMIQISARGRSGTIRTLVLAPGTEISILNLPEHHARMNFHKMNSIQDVNERHFYLVNELLPPEHQICNPTPPLRRLRCSARQRGCEPDGCLPPSPDGDPACSNTGCCP